MTKLFLTPAERVQAAGRQRYAAKSPTARVLKSPPAGAVARELIAAKYDVAAHTSEGVTPAYLLSREKSLLRELQSTESELAAVQAQLAQLPTAA